MTPNPVLAAMVGLLFGTGVYLLLSRSISRALLGVILMANGANVLFLMAAGPAGRAPISTLNAEGEMSDPLPQAMVLTAIVITLGMTAFILAMAHRSWQLARSDVVEDDLEDLRLVELADRDDVTNREPDGDDEDDRDDDRDDDEGGHGHDGGGESVAGAASGRGRGGAVGG